MSGAGIVCAAGVAVLAFGALLVLVARTARVWRLALAAQAVGMSAVGAAGAAVLFGAPIVGARFRSGFASFLWCSR
jgi:hypothetical protein